MFVFLGGKLQYQQCSPPSAFYTALWRFSSSRFRNKQKKTNTSAVGTHSRKTCTHTKTIRARADAPAHAASCKSVRFPPGKVQNMRKGSFTELAIKNVLKSQVNCARARAIIRRDAQRPFQPVTERARSTQCTTGTFQPKGGGQENGMLPSLGILKTMSINPWCHIWPCVTWPDI